MRPNFTSTPKQKEQRRNQERKKRNLIEILGDFLHRSLFLLRHFFLFPNVIQISMKCAQSKLKPDNAMADLFYAVEKGHGRLVAELLTEWPELIDARTLELKTSFHLAAERGHDDIMEQLLIRGGVSINQPDIYFWTPLHSACYHGHDKIVEQLLAQPSSSIDAVTRNDVTALHLAAERGHDKVVSLLLARRPALINKRDSDGRSALHFAAREGHEQVIALLLAQNPRTVEDTDSDWHTPLYYACANGHDGVLVQLAAHCPRLLDSVSWQDSTLMHAAAEGGYASTVNHLLRYCGPSAEFADLLGRTPLHCACQAGHLGVVQLLLDSEKLERYGQSCMHEAAGHGREMVVKYLVTRLPASSGRAWVKDALFCAARMDFEPTHASELIVSFLLDLYPELVFETDQIGNTLLHHVVEFHEKQQKVFSESLVATVFAMNHAQLRTVNLPRGLTPFHVALRSNNRWAVEHFQWKLPVEEFIACHLALRISVNLHAKPLIDALLSESLLVAMPRDLVNTISGFLCDRAKIR